jgi:hypothetical protein
MSPSIILHAIAPPPPCVDNRPAGDYALGHSSLSFAPWAMPTASATAASAPPHTTHLQSPTPVMEDMLSAVAPHSLSLLAPLLCHLHQIWERGIAWKSSTGADSHGLLPRP